MASAVSLCSNYILLQCWLNHNHNEMADKQVNYKPVLWRKSVDWVSSAADLLGLLARSRVSITLVRFSGFDFCNVVAGSCFCDPFDLCDPVVGFKSLFRWTMMLVDCWFKLSASSSSCVETWFCFAPTCFCANTVFWRDDCLVVKCLLRCSLGLKILWRRTLHLLTDRFLIIFWLFTGWDGINLLFAMMVLLSVVSGRNIVGFADVCFRFGTVAVLVVKLCPWYDFVTIKAALSC